MTLRSNFRIVPAFALVFLAMLPGCTTLGGSLDQAGAAEPGVRLSVTKAVGGLRALITDLAVPAEPIPMAVDAADEVALIEQARVSVVTAGAMQLDQPGLSAKAELATLAILLTLCRDRVRATHGVEAGSGPAQDAARMISQRCVAPLALMLG